MNRIRYWRKKRGLSAAALATAVGTTQPTIQRLETGEIRLKVEMMQRIAEALEVSPSDLLSATLFAEMRADVERMPFSGGKSVQSVLEARHLQQYRITTNALAGLGVAPGEARVFDCSVERLADLRTGDVVIAEAREIEGDSSAVLILRQYIAPGLLTTNRPGRNLCFSIPDDEIDVRIVAVLASA